MKNTLIHKFLRNTSLALGVLPGLSGASLTIAALHSNGESSRVLSCICIKCWFLCLSSLLASFPHTCSKREMEGRKDKACRHSVNNSSPPCRGRTLKSSCSHLLVELKGNSIWNTSHSLPHSPAHLVVVICTPPSNFYLVNFRKITRSYLSRKD